MKAVYTVGVKAYVKGAKNVHGNPVETWAAPVDLAVFSIAPRFSNEPDPSRAAVVSGVTLLVPAGAVVGPHDRVVIGGVEYEVEGEIADWTRGPFDWAPGVSINLKRVEG